MVVLVVCGVDEYVQRERMMVKLKKIVSCAFPRSARAETSHSEIGGSQCTHRTFWGSLKGFQEANCSDGAAVGGLTLYLVGNLFANLT